MRQILKLNMISSQINLYRLYNKLCTDYDLSLTGGPFPRCRGQPVTEKTDENIKNIIRGLNNAINDMESGKFLDQKTKLVVQGIYDKRYNVCHVGKVGGLSFPALCVFTGISQSHHSIEAAKYAQVNMQSEEDGSRYSYCNKLTKYLNNVHGEGKSDEIYYHRTMMSIASSLEEHQSSIENGCCARFRSIYKWDSYFKDHDIYKINKEVNKVQVKTFGTKEWCDINVN